MYLYVGDYGVEITSPTIYDTDGVTPLLPVSATVTIRDMIADSVVLSSGACAVASGSASYSIPSGSAVTSASSHYVAYFAVSPTSGSQRTFYTYFDVLDQASLLILDTWRRKVSSSSPDDSLITDEAARDWIDDAVAYINKHYGINDYTSALGVLSPSPTANDREFYASVAALMARTAWWAGKGTWRDGEMSLNVSPFRDEWERLDALMTAARNEDLFAVYDVFNRDRVLDDSFKYDSPLYPYVLSGSTAPTSVIPI